MAINDLRELKIVFLTPDELTPYSRNTRKHNPADIEQIKTSILRDGFNDPIGIWGEKNIVVEGHGRLIAGNAKGYVNEIFKAFREAGYEPQLFLLNAAFMGVPQRRERTVFIARRKDLALQKIRMAFNEPPVYFGEVRSEHGRPIDPKSKVYKLLQMRQAGDKYISDIHKRWNNGNTGFTQAIINETDVAPTLVAGSLQAVYRFVDGDCLSDQDIVNIQTFPQDYDFGKERPQYVCGMSVPPVMMAQIATEVYEQWLK